MKTPDVITIRTAGLAWFVANAQLVVINTMTYSRGRPIPGAVGLTYSDFGSGFSDRPQVQLQKKMSESSGGDMGRPIVTVGWNSEQFDSRNLALRLVAMGYTNVYWHRGGREAWKAAVLPEADVTPTGW